MGSFLWLRENLKGQSGKVTDDHKAVIDALKRSCPGYEKFAFARDHLWPVSWSSEDLFQARASGNIIDSFVT